MAATSTTFHVTISQVSGLVFSGETDAITVPGVEGDMTILAHHEPLISLLRNGTISVGQNGEVQTFPIKQGTLEVSNNQVTILV